MSLAAELLMARIAEDIGPAQAFLSWSGQGCPLLDLAAQPPHRLAMRPLGGVMPGGGTRLAGWTPPFDIGRDRSIAARLARGGLMMADTVADEVLWKAMAPAVGVIRVRGAPARSGKVAKPGFTLIFSDDSVPPERGDHVLIREDLLTDGIRRFAAALTARELDEFDRLHMLVRGGDIVREIRFRAGQSECHLHPVRVLDQPDGDQIDAALGEGRLVLDRDGLASLVLPQFAAAAAPVGITVRANGPSTGRPSPRLLFDMPQDWRVTVTNRRQAWDLVAHPVSPAPSEVTSFELRLADGAGHEVSAAWVGISRRRAEWEDWDEADARLALEENW